MDLYERVTQPLLRDDFAETLHEALLRHPSEAYLPFIASVDASRRGKSVVPWVERALELAPVYPPAHFVLAEQLEASSPAQSRLEYRIAMSQDSLLIDPSLRRATRLVSDYDDALELAPAGRFRPIVLEELASTLSGRLPATRERLDELSRKADPNAQGPLWRTVSDVIADLEAGEAAPWCEDRTKCVRPGLAAAKKLTTLRPGACGPQVSLTRLALAADDNPNALRDLQAAAQTASDPMECWRALAELAMSSRNETYVTIAEDAMARSGCLSDSECADNLVAVAVLEERRGNYRSAIGYYERAQEKGPGRRDIVERVGQLASSLGMHAQALDAYRRLEHMSPDANQWRQLADKEKMQLYHEGPP
jgi:tetratricopeptide (TPR) repeat protein